MASRIESFLSCDVDLREQKVNSRLWHPGEWVVKRELDSGNKRRLINAGAPSEAIRVREERKLEGSLVARGEELREKVLELLGNIDRAELTQPKRPSYYNDIRREVITGLLIGRSISAEHKSLFDGVKVTFYGSPGEVHSHSFNRIDIALERTAAQKERSLSFTSEELAETACEATGKVFDNDEVLRQLVFRRKFEFGLESEDETIWRKGAEICAVINDLETVSNSVSQEQLTKTRDELTAQIMRFWGQRKQDNFVVDNLELTVGQLYQASSSRDNCEIHVGIQRGLNSLSFVVPSPLNTENGRIKSKELLRDLPKPIIYDFYLSANSYYDRHPNSRTNLPKSY